MAVPHHVGAVNWDGAVQRSGDGPGQAITQSESQTYSRRCAHPGGCECRMTLVQARTDVVLNSDKVRQLRVERKGRVIFGLILPRRRNPTILELQIYECCRTYVPSRYGEYPFKGFPNIGSFLLEMTLAWSAVDCTPSRFGGRD